VTRARVALAACAALAWPMLAAAQATFTSQVRKVETKSHSNLLLWQQGTNLEFPVEDPATVAYSLNDDHVTSAPDFTPFETEAVSTAPLRPGRSAASQRSSLDPQAVRASARIDVSGEPLWLGAQALAAANALLHPPVPYNNGYLGGTESAISKFDAEFELSEPTPYHLVGSLAAGFGPPGFPSLYKGTSASFKLEGPGGTVLSDQLISCACEHELDHEGVLAPGSYTLHVVGGAYITPDFCRYHQPCFAEAADAAFDVNLWLGVEPPVEPDPPVVPGPSRGLAALLGLALAAIGVAALRRS
jgi:hypothetical protein